MLYRQVRDSDFLLTQSLLQRQKALQICKSWLSTSGLFMTVIIYQNMRGQAPTNSLWTSCQSEGVQGLGCARRADRFEDFALVRTAVFMRAQHRHLDLLLRALTEADMLASRAVTVYPAGMCADFVRMRRNRGLQHTGSYSSVAAYSDAFFTMNPR